MKGQKGLEGHQGRLLRVQLLKTENFATLAALLRERRRVIADHEWRDRDAAGHLAALQRVSEAIDRAAAALGPAAPARLRHFLANASFDKALAFLEASGVDDAAGAE